MYTVTLLLFLQLFKLTSYYIPMLTVSLFQMEELRKQYHSLLIDIGFLPKKFRLKDTNHAANVNSQNIGLIKAVLCAGLYPNIVVAPRSVVASNSKEKNKKKVGEHAFRSHKRVRKSLLT